MPKPPHARWRAGAQLRGRGRARHGIRSLWISSSGQFLIRYAIVTALAFCIPSLWPSIDHLMIRATLASLSVAWLVVPDAVRVFEATFTIGSTSIQIVPDCTPLFPMLLLAGGVLAYPAPWKDRIIGLLLGTSTLWVYNVVRIFLLIAVMRYAPDQFDLVHVYLWQTLTILAVVGCFLWWARGLDRLPTPR